MLNRAFPMLAVLALAASTSAGFADGLTARISVDKIAMGDSFQLRLSADPSQISAPPDVSALNTDFDILGTSKSTQTQIINGTRTDTVEWIINLSPRAKGHLTIPVLTAGNASSQALALDVVDASDVPAGEQSQSTTRLEATLDAGNHYVQQEIPLTLRITAGQGFRGGAIVTPESPDYILEQRGEDKTSQITHDGKPVTVIERDYLLRPQKSGALTIAPFTLQGTEDDLSQAATTRQNPFDSLFGRSPFAGAFGGASSPFDQMFTPGRNVVVRSAPLTLAVKANPSNAADWFLPAKDVQITAEWEPKSPQLRVGEAVTRHVRIQALGATQVQLPDLALPQVSGAKIYLEGSQAGSVDTAKGTAAVRDFTYSIVPTSGGEMTLPEVEVKWFDTGTETQRVARLPAETHQIEGAIAAPQTAAPTAAASTAKLPAAPKTHSALWLGPLLVALVVFVAGLVTFWVRKRNTVPNSVSKPIPSAKRKTALAQIEQACRAGDAKAAYAAAAVWLRIVAGDKAQTERDVLRQFPDLAKAWAQLEAQVFSGDDKPTWDAQAFGRAIAAAERLANLRDTPIVKTRLPPLYPAYDNQHGAV